MSNKVFNLIITGYGGQGVLTMAEIIAKAALLSGYNVKQAELHGLAQRGGTLECHLRFGKKVYPRTKNFGEGVYSPLVLKTGADLIISLDLLEALGTCYYANKKKTIMLTNSEIFTPHPFEPGKIEAKKLIANIKKIVKKLELVNAFETTKKITKDTAMINTLMLGYAAAKKFLPIKKEFILKAMKEKIRPIFWQDNLKIFEIPFGK